MNRKLAATIEVGTKVTYTWRNTRYQPWTTTAYTVVEIIPAEKALRPHLGREFVLKTDEEIATGRLGILVAERGKTSSKILAA